MNEALLSKNCAGQKQLLHAFCIGEGRTWAIMFGLLTAVVVIIGIVIAFVLN